MQRLPLGFLPPYLPIKSPQPPSGALRRRKVGACGRVINQLKMFRKK